MWVLYILTELYRTYSTLSAPLQLLSLYYKCSSGAWLWTYVSHWRIMSSSFYLTDVPVRSLMRVSCWGTSSSCKSGRGWRRRRDSLSISQTHLKRYTSLVSKLKVEMLAFRIHKSYDSSEASYHALKPKASGIQEQIEAQVFWAARKVSDATPYWELWGDVWRVEEKVRTICVYKRWA